MKRLFQAFRDTAAIIWKKNKWLVLAVFASGVLSGLLAPFGVWINSRIFDAGLEVARGRLSFPGYIPYLLGFIAAALLPVVAGDLLADRYILPRCRLILRAELRGAMLQKLKRLRYDHLESKDSVEVIDKAYARTEEASLALFPQAVQKALSTGIASVGTLMMLGAVRWWLLPVALVPFALETWLSARANQQLYDEQERYWQQERTYEVLGQQLRSRDFLRENRLLGASDYLVDHYEERMRGRNRQYERFFLRHLRRNFFKRDLTRLAQLACALLLLWCYRQGGLTIGALISLTAAVFGSLFSLKGLQGLVRVVKNSGGYRNDFRYYDQYMALPEEESGPEDDVPAEASIEFRDVWFRYPGSSRPILKGASFHIRAGEKISLVGENGAGKSTVIKLLLGLFQPDQGEILVGGKPLSAYSQRARTHLFGTVFQDFARYSITLRENIGVGDPEGLEDLQAIRRAAETASLGPLLQTLPRGLDTDMGREFGEGVDLSGGQWQRIAIARAFMGAKPILILDEPTSQLDPMAESQLYTEMAHLAEGKTSLFITHRLGSTRITDRILVLDGGKVVQSGSHEELMGQEGLYAAMFQAQKHWYIREGGDVNG